MHLAEVRRRLYSSQKKKGAKEIANLRLRAAHVAYHGESRSSGDTQQLHSLQRRRNPQSCARWARFLRSEEEGGKQ